MTDPSATRKYPSQRNNSSDHFQTPAEALDPLLPYLNKNWTIWEPACGKGNLVQALDDHGYNVFGTDILPSAKCVGRDFLISPAPFPYHAIVTNPAYTLKDEFLERCYELGRPFALLLPLTVFDSVRRRKLFAKHGVEVIFLPKRVNFETPNHGANVAAGKKTSSWFCVCWISWGLNIGRQLVFTDA